MSSAYRYFSPGATSTAAAAANAPTADIQGPLWGPLGGPIGVLVLGILLQLSYARIA